MLSIQEAGKAILSGNPGKFYIFAGDEYGVKSKYLSIIKSHYNNECIEVETAEAVFNIMSTKHLIPLSPKLYIVRYDDSFISDINSSTASMINNMKIIGTVICVYQSSKHTAKCDKYLSNYTVVFDSINTEFIKKYLISDFPKLPTSLIDFAVSARPDYKSASNICNCLAYLNSNLQNSADVSELSFIFGCSSTSTEEQFKLGIASKNFGYCLSVLETYGGDLNNLFYSILSTLIELEKLLGITYSQSPFHKYIKCWSYADIYFMFMHTYEELKKSRSYNSYDVKDSIVYLLGILQFSSIPTMEVLKCEVG